MEGVYRSYPSSTYPNSSPSVLTYKPHTGDCCPVLVLEPSYVGLWPFKSGVSFPVAVHVSWWEVLLIFKASAIVAHLPSAHLQGWGCPIWDLMPSSGKTSTPVYSSCLWVTTMLAIWFSTAFLPPLPFWVCVYISSCGRAVLLVLRSLSELVTSY